MFINVLNFLFLTSTTTSWIIILASKNNLQNCDSASYVFIITLLLFSMKNQLRNKTYLWKCWELILTDTSMLTICSYIYFKGRNISWIQTCTRLFRRNYKFCYLLNDPSDTYLELFLYWKKSRERNINMINGIYMWDIWKLINVKWKHYQSVLWQYYPLSVASLSTHFPIDLTLFYFPFFFLNPPSQTFVSQLFFF